MLIATEPLEQVNSENAIMEKVAMPSHHHEQVGLESAIMEESLVVTETVPLHSLLGLLTPVPIASVPSHMHSTPPPLLPQLPYANQDLQRVPGQC